MFGLMRHGWIVTKGIREIVIIAEREGFIMPSKREEAITGITKFSADLGIAHKGISGHEQVMITTMAFFGIAAGPVALADATGWAAEYASRHKLRDVLGPCMETAADLVAACK